MELDRHYRVRVGKTGRSSARRDRASAAGPPADTPRSSWLNSLDVWLQAIVNGIALGWLYVLMALGLTLILEHHGHPPTGARRDLHDRRLRRLLPDRPGARPLPGDRRQHGRDGRCSGILLERGLFRPRRTADVVLSSIVISTGLTLILSSAAVVGFGLYTKSLPPLDRRAPSSLLGGRASPRTGSWPSASRSLALVVLYVFLKRTRLGLAMVASAQNREGLLPQGHQPQPHVHGGHGDRLRPGRSRRARWPAPSSSCSPTWVAAHDQGPRHHRAGRPGQHPRRGHRRSDPRAHRRHRAGVLRLRPSAFSGPLVIVILVLLFRPKGLLGHD